MKVLVAIHEIFNTGGNEIEEFEFNDEFSKNDFKEVLKRIETFIEETHKREFNK